MMREEFEKLTGIYPDALLYKAIEKAYMESDQDKQIFCADYKANKDALAERVQFSALEMSMRENNEKDRAVELWKKTAEQWKAECKRLEAALDRELEWRPFEPIDEVEQKDYARLAAQRDTRELVIQEAIDMIYEMYGFARERVTVITSIPKLQVNKYHRTRQVGSIDRVPLYNSTDWNYIRFECAGIEYEIDNGNLKKCR